MLAIYQAPHTFNEWVINRRVYKQQAVIPQLMASNTTITNDELFWLSAAQVWCQVETKEQAYNQIAFDSHSPGTIH